jgi:hypothetical protein
VSGDGEIPGELGQGGGGITKNTAADEEKMREHERLYEGLDPLVTR